MRVNYTFLLKLIILFFLIILLLAFHDKSKNHSDLIKYDKQIKVHNKTDSHFVYSQDTATINDEKRPEYNVWCTFCKASPLSPLKYKFSTFINSLVNFSSVPLNINVITDNVSQPVAEEVVTRLKNSSQKHFQVSFYNIKNVVSEINRLIKTLRYFFVSQQDSYFSDALFFVSIGLHKIALNQSKVVMVDIDVKFKTDVKLLFDEFNNFGKEAVIGIAFEQSPVYRHVLYMYRNQFRNTSFGNPVSKNGNPGVNSGVLLLDLNKIRTSRLYNKFLVRHHVKRLVHKYMFRGHLGDQDWYTLLSLEHRELFYFLDCTWNRQLCKWWEHHGYKDVFKMFHSCSGDVKIYHGNCNTPIPV